jgi:hypothetical protein
VSNLKALILLHELGMVLQTIVDTPKDSLHANVLAVKHDICSFADWGKSRSHSLSRAREEKSRRARPGLQAFITFICSLAELFVDYFQSCSWCRLYNVDMYWF